MKILTQWNQQDNLVRKAWGLGWTFWVLSTGYRLGFRCHCTSNESGPSRQRCLGMAVLSMSYCNYFESICAQICQGAWAKVRENLLELVLSSHVVSGNRCHLAGLVVRAGGAVPVSSVSYWDEVISIMRSRHKVSCTETTRCFPHLQRNYDDGVILLSFQQADQSLLFDILLKKSHCPLNGSSLLLLHLRVNLSSVMQMSTSSGGFRFSPPTRPTSNKWSFMRCTFCEIQIQMTGLRHGSSDSSLVCGSCSLRPQWRPGTEERTLLQPKRVYIHICIYCYLKMCLVIITFNG